MYQQSPIKNGIVYLSDVVNLPLLADDAPRDPLELLDETRADTQRCAGDLARAAMTLGADRSITEQREEAEPVAIGVDLKAEQRVVGAVIVALAECPSAAKAAGLTADEVKEDLQAALDAQVITEQAGQLARGAREASFVLGHGLWAVIDRAREGLTYVVGSAGTPEEAAAARDDLESLEAPLRLEAEARNERAAATRQGQAEIGGKIDEARETASSMAPTVRAELAYHRRPVASRYCVGVSAPARRSIAVMSVSRRVSPDSMASASCARP